MVSDTIDFALKAAWPFDKSGPQTPPWILAFNDYYNRYNAVETTKNYTT